jgi:hypothetical protein
MRAIRKIAVLGAALAAFGTIGVGTALADPSAPPALTDIVGVGSGITAQVFDNGIPGDQTGTLSHDYNATHSGSELYSWDAVNPATGQIHDGIVTKGTTSPPAPCSMARPYGSREGIAALNTMDGSDYCVDFARYSTLAQPPAPDTIAFVEMAGDATTWSSPGGTSSTPSPVPATLTLAQLVSIYNCTVTNWDQVGGDNAPIVAVLPPNGSDTRANFLRVLGGGMTPLAPGSCVVNGTDSSGNPIDEDTGVTTGNVNEFGTVSAPNVDAIFPYTISSYIAQGPAANGVGGHSISTWARGDLLLHDIIDTHGVSQPPTVQNGSNQTVINPSFPLEFQQVVWNAVRNGCPSTSACFPTTPSYAATTLPAIFGPSGWICTNATARADLISYGFYLEGSECGNISVALP